MSLEKSPLILELGDIIEIQAPTNDVLNNKIFFINYIDKTTIKLINDKDLTKETLTIDSDRNLTDQSIQSISILDKAKEKGYAKQNNLILNTWIDIYFGGDIPAVITGEITNTEEDMIEIKSYSDGSIIYIDFAYKGIPKDLPIDKVVIREKPTKVDKEIIIEEGVIEKEKVADVDVDADVYVDADADADEEIKDLGDIADAEGEMREMIDVPSEEVEERIQQTLLEADQVVFGDNLDSITQFVEVEETEKRYGLDTQLSDLLDELLASIPNAKRNNNVLNSIHTIIERFKQLRNQYSVFDSNGNPSMIDIKGIQYKPLTHILEKLNTKLFWIIPVVQNKLKVYDAFNTEDIPDIVDLILYTALSEQNEQNEQYFKNHLVDSDNPFLTHLKNMNQFATPFERPDLISNALINKEVETNLNVIVNNLENFYSSIVNKEEVARRKYLIETYNLGIKQITKDKTLKLLPADKLSLYSLVTMPYSFVQYSSLYRPSSSILTKANLNKIHVNYWQSLKNNTDVESKVIDSLEKSVSHSSLLNKIHDFQLDESIVDESGDKYKKFLDVIIPKTDSIFNMMKEHIVNHVSYTHIIGSLEPFLIYNEDISYKTYEKIVDYIREQILEFKKEFARKNMIFTKLRASFHNLYKGSFILAFLTESVTEKYELSNSLTTSELIIKILLTDQGRLFMNTLSLSNMKLYSNIDINETINENIENLKRETHENTCKDFVLVKKYIDINELQEDNDIEDIYVDSKYDTTRYDILNEYEQGSMNLDEFTQYVAEQLQLNIGLNDEAALYESESMIQGKRKVKNGQYAVVELFDPNDNPEIQYFIRRDNQWVLGENINIKSATSSDVFCNAQPKCLSINKECLDKETIQHENEKEYLQRIVNNFENELLILGKKLAKIITELYEYNFKTIDTLKTLSYFDMIRYNINKKQLGLTVPQRDLTVSPYLNIMNLILGDADFIRRQRNIIKFAATYTVDGDSIYMRNCVDTNQPLLPTFFIQLAEAYENGTYMEVLDQICKERGEISDDGDSWVDKYSGYTIKKIDFDIQEGYDEGGYKLVSRDVLEEDLGQSVLQSSERKNYKFKEANIISNIISTITNYMGISINSEIDFIVKNVSLTLKEKVPSKEQYTTRVEIAKKKGKKIPSYDFTFNNLLLLLTLGYIIVAIQTMVPSIRTNKTFPGCIRSLKGFPYYDKSDYSTIKYIACISTKIKANIEPWNTLKKINEENLTEKLKTIIEITILPNLAVKDKFAIKDEYLQKYSEDDKIPPSLDINTWKTFLPPLSLQKVVAVRQVTKEFQELLKQHVITGNKAQIAQINHLLSKMMYNSFAIQETIQRVINKEDVILKNNNDDAFLENVCCNDGIQQTLKYFIDKESSISLHNENATKISALYYYYFTLVKARIFNDKINTKLVYPKLNKAFSESTIYQAFIHYCKYNTDLPVSNTLQRICKNNKSAFTPSSTLNERVSIMKSEGINYTTEDFDRLIEVIERENYININLSTEIITPENIFQIYVNYLLNTEHTISMTLLKLLKERSVNPLRDFLLEENNSMKAKVIEFLTTSGQFKKQQMTKIIEFLNTLKDWKSQGDIFMSNEADQTYKLSQWLFQGTLNINRVFPSIILNNVSYDEVMIPKHWNLSDRHKKDVIKIIHSEFQKLEKFYSSDEGEESKRDIEPVLEKVIKHMNELNRLLILTPFMEKVNKDLFEYYFLFSLLSYIDIQENSDTLIDEVSFNEDIEVATSVEFEEQNTGTITQLDIVRGERLQMNEKIASILITYIEIIMNTKKQINTNKEQIMERTLRSQEKEKEEITTYLRDLTDEQREIENILKNNKLGKWSKGQTKGLVEYVGEIYDEEVASIEQRALLEKRVGMRSEVTDLNRDIYVLEEFDQQMRENIADGEAYDMSGLANDDDYGDQDGDEHFY
uniref:Uncharacterized protein n=1 Tax=viral metagenome TaxID=1070528 RepID=A0A6C0KH20_9ZZZZ